MSMSDQRKHPRIPMSGLVIVKVPEKNLQFSGTIELISLGGVGVYTKEKVTVGTLVSIQLVSFTGSDTLNYNLKGTIRNNERGQEFGVLGIEFEKEINSKEHLPLYQYLINKASKPQ